MSLPRGSMHDPQQRQPCSSGGQHLHTIPQYPPPPMLILYLVRLVQSEQHNWELLVTCTGPRAGVAVSSLSLAEMIQSELNCYGNLRYSKGLKKGKFAYMSPRKVSTEQHLPSVIQLLLFTLCWCKKWCIFRSLASHFAFYAMRKCDTPLWCWAMQFEQIAPRGP